ncbi:MAG: DUF1211 domain-containing protein [Ktedonobacteraceae bacterium]|nr:DUF1211 domain-containing protein [Ktedonobacteraceae bacterium]
MQEKETGRVEAFSDGVFAVAITLLVLNIKVPGLLPDDKGLWAVLAREWSMYVAYITSFATIGIMWLNHHRILVHIRRTDTILILLNLLLLSIIVLIPVPTDLLAEYLVRPDMHVAAIIYSSMFFVMSCCFNFLWRYASHENRLLAKNVSPQAVAAINQQYLCGPLFYTVTFVVAWFNAPISILLNFILALFFAIPGPSLASFSGRMKREETVV